MNLPNKITVLRIILIPIFMIFAFPLPAFIPCLNTVIPQIAIDVICFVIFLAATLTDMLDGKIARKYNLITDFGKFLDPIADKLLVAAALCAISFARPIYLWALMVVLIREFVVTGFRLVASSKGVVIAAGKLGKWKTATQTVGLCILFGAPIAGYIMEILGTIVRWTGDIVMIVSVILTIVSGVEYLVKNWNLMDGEM